MIKKNNKGEAENHRAITALLSTILLLAIAVCLVTVIYTAILNNTTNQSTESVTSANLAASITQDRNITFTNQRGRLS